MSCYRVWTKGEKGPGLTELLTDVTVTCPFCWERISLQLDLSVPAQDYVEDCAVCCRPMRVRYAVEAGELDNLTVTNIDE